MDEKKNLETLGGLCSHMLSSPMPTSDDRGMHCWSCVSDQRALPILSMA